MSMRTITLVLLPVLSFIGAFGTLYLIGSNGTSEMIRGYIRREPAYLPGTSDPLLKSYSGVKGIDRQLLVLVTFFSPTFDLNNRDLSLFSLFGGGQLGAAWTLMMLESVRTGNKGKLITYVGVVGFIFQNITLTITLPLWLFQHLLTSPVAKPLSGLNAKSIIQASSLDLGLLPLSVTLGYIVPTVLMGLPSPSIVSLSQHQKFIALWQPFPAWTVVIHWALQYVFKQSASKETTDGPSTASGSRSLRTADFVYTFALIQCAITHIPALAIALVPQSIFSEYLPALIFPSSSDFLSVYVPYYPTPGTQVSSLAEGVHAFLQWDLHVSATAFLLWAILLYRNVTIESKAGFSIQKMLEKIAFWTLIAGPFGASTALLWERDAIITQKTKDN